MARSFEYITADQVVAAHEALLAAYGGLEGGGHRGSDYQGVDAAVRAVENAYYEDVHELAAAYAVYIVQGHVFLDGNKRAAGFAMTNFLRANGVRALPSQERVVALLVELQRRSEAGESTGDLVQWVAESLRVKRGRSRR